MTAFRKHGVLVGGIRGRTRFCEHQQHLARSHPEGWLKLTADADSKFITDDHHDQSNERKVEDSLGSIARFVSNQSYSQVSEMTEETIKAKRYRLQSVAARILPHTRVRVCRRFLIPGQETVEFTHNPDGHAGHRAKFRGLQICGSVWLCPVCASVISEYRRRELVLAAARNDYFLSMVTLTFRHNLGDRLADLRERFKLALQRFVGGRDWVKICETYSLLGHVTAHEITNGYTTTHDNGWHPHAHLLFFMESPLSYLEKAQFERDCREKWQRALANAGLDAAWEIGCNVRDGDNAVAEYVAKFDRLPKDESWGVGHEVVKATSKLGADNAGLSVFALLELAGQGDDRAIYLVREFAAAYKGKRQLRYSPGLRKLLGLGAEVADEIVAADNPDSVLDVFTWDEWQAVIRKGRERRAELLAVGDSGDVVAVRNWIHKELLAAAREKNPEARSQKLVKVRIDLRLLMENKPFEVVEVVEVDPSPAPKTVPRKSSQNK